MNWLEAPLSELLSADFDGAWGPEASDGEGVPVLRSTDMRNGKLSFDNTARRNIDDRVIAKKRLMDGDILVNKSSGSAHLVGASVIFFAPDRGDYMCSNFIRCLRANSEVIDPALLQLAIQSPDFRNQAFGAQRTTSGLRNLKIAEYKSCNIRFPQDAEDQQRIKHRISECMEGIEEIELLRAESKQETRLFLRSYYHDLYEDLVASTPTRPLTDFGDSAGGGTPSKKQPEFWNGTIPWVSPKEMKVRDIYDTSLAITEAAVSGSSVKLLEKPSVLFVVRGMILAHTLPVAVNRVPVTLNQDMKSITPHDGINVDFLATMLRGAERRLLRAIDIAGHGTRRLKTEIWSATPIPDLDLDAQLEIVERVSAMEALGDQLAEDIEGEEVFSLRDAILRKAFSGEL